MASKVTYQWVLCHNCNKLDTGITRFGKECPDCCRSKAGVARLCEDCCPSGHQTRLRKEEVKDGD